MKKIFYSFKWCNTMVEILWVFGAPFLVLWPRHDVVALSSHLSRRYRLGRRDVRGAHCQKWVLWDFWRREICDVFDGPVVWGYRSWAYNVYFGDLRILVSGSVVMLLSLQLFLDSIVYSMAWWSACCYWVLLVVVAIYLFFLCLLFRNKGIDLYALLVLVCVVLLLY